MASGGSNFVQNLTSISIDFTFLDAPTRSTDETLSTDLRIFRHVFLIIKHVRVCRHGILAPACISVTNRDTVCDSYVRHDRCDCTARAPCVENITFVYKQFWSETFCFSTHRNCVSTRKRHEMVRNKLHTEYRLSSATGSSLFER